MWVVMSERVRWWVFEGEMGMGMAPEREAMPPASLYDFIFVGCVSFLMFGLIGGGEGGGGRFTSRLCDFGSLLGRCGVVRLGAFAYLVGFPLFRLSRKFLLLFLLGLLHIALGHWWWGLHGRRRRGGWYWL